MAKPKCKWCKADLDIKTALKITVDNKNQYYCNEEHYHLAEKAKREQDKINQEYDQIFKTTQEIFGYEFTGYPLLKREINAWEKIATRQKVIDFLNENKDWLSKTMSRDFNNDYGRVRYYSVVVSGKLHDFKPRVEEKIIEKKVDTTFYDISDVVNKPKRRALDDLEDEV